MRKLLALPLFVFLIACNNNKNEKTETNATTNADGTTNTSTDNTSPADGSAVMIVHIDGSEIRLSASALVSKDKKNLQAGSPWFAMITSSDGPNQESLILNFVFDTKAGDYPVVGVGFNRGSGDNSEVFGGLMGGEPKITQYKVHLTEVKDLGSNQIGGHKWSISGTFDEMTVPAMGIMLMDETKKHPKEINIKGGSFSNITFDDNWEEVMEKAFEKTKDQ